MKQSLSSASLFEVEWPCLEENEIEACGALAARIASLVRDEPSVQEFREKVLRGATLNSADAATFINSPAPRLLLLRDFVKHGIDVLEHRARVREYDGGSRTTPTLEECETWESLFWLGELPTEGYVDIHRVVLQFDGLRIDVERTFLSSDRNDFPIPYAWPDLPADPRDPHSESRSASMRKIAQECSTPEDLEKRMAEASRRNMDPGFTFLGSVVGRLSLISRRVAEMFDYHHIESIANFVLTDHLEPDWPFRMSMSHLPLDLLDFIEKREDGWRHSVSLTVEPWISDESLIRLFRELRNGCLGPRSRHRLPNKETFTVVRFVESQQRIKKDHWPNLYRAWKQEFPQSAIGSPQALSNAYRRGLNVLIQRKGSN